VVQDLQRDLRRRLEQEVKDIQEQICRDEDDVYFRELDAQRLRTKLKLSRFQGAV
jgi:centrosomal protein CEP95